jgi:mannitol-specific phosphotransferase system IIBC component
MNYLGRLALFVGLWVLIISMFWDHGWRPEAWQVVVPSGIVGLLPLLTGTKRREGE